MRIVKVLDDSRCDFHYTQLIECDDRTMTIRKSLENFDIIDSISEIDLDHPALLRVHKKKYIEIIVNKCRRNKFEMIENDVAISGEDSLVAIRIAAHSGIIGVDMVMQNEADSVFCNVKPPGHHAEKGKAKGFCFFNNIAIAAEHALMEYPNIKIAIIDWDVHHGNGTQDYVRDKPILFINIQQKGIYPGSGRARHKGNIFSYNMNPGDGDDEMKLIFEHVLDDLKQFGPDLILISCGFDAHVLDPLSDIKLSSEMYGWMTRQLTFTKIVSILEGGYNLQALSESSKEHVFNLQQK